MVYKALILSMFFSYIEMVFFAWTNNDTIGVHMFFFYISILPVLLTIINFLLVAFILVVLN